MKALPIILAMLLAPLFQIVDIGTQLGIQDEWFEEPAPNDAA